MPVIYSVENGEDVEEIYEQPEEILHINGLNGPIDEPVDTQLLIVHSTAAASDIGLNIYLQLGIHISCYACHSECNDLCDGNHAQHIRGHYTDHLLIMHFVHFHPAVTSIALWHNSALRNFESLEGVLDFIHSRFGYL